MRFKVLFSFFFFFIQNYKGGGLRTISNTFSGFLSYVGLDGVKIGLEIFKNGMSIIPFTVRAFLKFFNIKSVLVRNSLAFHIKLNFLFWKGELNVESVVFRSKFQTPYLSQIIQYTSSILH
jgi:hypothetical protein